MTARYTPAPPGATERDAMDAFARERLQPWRWSNGPSALYAPHGHPYDKVLYCLRGSITFLLTDEGTEFELQPGDRLDIEPGTVHSAIVGREGVECVEAARG